MNLMNHGEQIRELEEWEEMKKAGQERDKTTVKEKWIHRQSVNPL